MAHAPEISLKRFFSPWDWSWVIIVLLMLWGANVFDWDFFLSTVETDVRGWWEHGGPPLWSYQFCGGSVRAADPQSFGHSLFFIFPLIFGTYLGTKLIAFTGFVGAVRGWTLWARQIQGDLSAQDEAFTRFCFALSSFFILHGYHGHVAFASFGLFLPVTALAMQAWEKGLSYKQMGEGALWAWLGWSTGFYGGVIYLLAPFLIVYGLVALIRFGQKEARRGLALTALMVGVGLVLVLPKLVLSFSYIKGHPRILKTDEVLGLVGLLQAWFVPVESAQRWFFGGHHQAWSPAEYAVFSPFQLILLILPLWWMKGERWKPSQPMRWVLGGAGSLALLLAFGKFSGWAPFTLLNENIFKSSVRVTGRFLFLPWLIFCLAMLKPWIWLKDRHGLLSRIPMIMVALGIPLACFFPLTWGFWVYDEGIRFRHVSEEFIGPMNEAVFPPSSNDVQSRMYEDVARGKILLHCYQALSRDKRPAGWAYVPLAYLPGKIPLIDIRHTPVTESCFAGTFVTQESLTIDSSCPHYLCLNLVALNPYVDHSGWSEETDEKGRLCLRKTDANSRTEAVSP